MQMNEETKGLPVVGWVIRVAGTDSICATEQLACETADMCSRNGVEASAYAVADYDAAAEALAQRDAELAELRGDLDQARKVANELREALGNTLSERDALQAELARLKSAVADYDAADDDAEWSPPHPIFQMAAEIDALQAELAAIRSASDPALEVVHGPLGSDGVPEWVKVVTLGEFDIENLPNGMQLYAAPVSAPSQVAAEVVQESQPCPGCQARFPANSWEAGFRTGSGMCVNCDAALPAKDLPDRETELLDWLEEQAKSSPSGISFDYARYVEDGQVLEHGFRFMRRFFLGERKKTLRDAIEAALLATSQGEA